MTIHTILINIDSFDFHPRSKDNVEPRGQSWPLRPDESLAALGFGHFFTQSTIINNGDMHGHLLLHCILYDYRIIS